MRERRMRGVALLVLACAGAARAGRPTALPLLARPHGAPRPLAPLTAAAPAPRPLPPSRPFHLANPLRPPWVYILLLLAIGAKAIPWAPTQATTEAQAKKFDTWATVVMSFAAFLTLWAFLLPNR